MSRLSYPLYLTHENLPQPEKEKKHETERISKRIWYQEDLVCQENRHQPHLPIGCIRGKEENSGKVLEEDRTVNPEESKNRGFVQ
ncbi:hypothetical protein LCGC14_0456980 [marine sediment metagenome]|uniref:Uncharacterized protein n=1 Tax=marine sediment metagenome TaxID=412755 RepID=A0A0F9V329_9ZZZZ